MRQRPKDDPASPVRLAVYGTCAGTAAIGLGQGLGSALFSAATARLIALAVIAALVSVAAGMVCDPILSRWQRIANLLHRRDN